MIRALFAGALALALLGFLPATSQQVQASELYGTAAGPLTQVNVARIKAALRLTPEQQAYWPPIEAVLHQLERNQSATASADAGFVRRVSSRVISIVLDSAATARLAAAARPLVRILNDDQKQIAIALAQEMGLGPMLAAL